MSLLRDFLFEVNYRYIHTTRGGDPDGIYFEFVFVKPSYVGKDFVLDWSGTTTIELPFKVQLPVEEVGDTAKIWRKVWDVLDLRSSKDDLYWWMRRIREEGIILSHSSSHPFADKLEMEFDVETGLPTTFYWEVTGQFGVEVMASEVFTSVSEISDIKFQQEFIIPLLRRVVDEVMVPRLRRRGSKVVTWVGEPSFKIDMSSLYVKVKGDPWVPLNVVVSGVVGPPVEVAEKFLNAVYSYWTRRDWKGLVSFITHAVIFRILRTTRRWSYRDEVDFTTTLQHLTELREFLDTQLRPTGKGV